MYTVAAIFHPERLVLSFASTIRFTQYFFANFQQACNEFR